MGEKQTTTALISICDEFAAGIRSLAAFVEQHGYQTWLYFLERYTGLAQAIPDKSMDCLVEAVAAKSPTVIGISVRSFYYDTARALTSRLREAMPDVLIAWGGAHPTILPGECIKYTDVVCLGEGEESLLDLLETLESQQWPVGIEGMWVRNGAAIIERGFRLPIQDLDSIPFAQYGNGGKFLIENGECVQYDGIPLGNVRKAGIKKYNLITSRGCRFSCSYCINSFLCKRYSKGHYVRRRSVENVMAELCLVKDSIDLVDFQDDDFLADREWVKRFLSEYVAIVGRPFVCLATPVHVREEAYLEELRRAGLVSLCMGIQSGSERMQKVFRRSLNKDFLVQVARTSNRLGILPQFDVILDNPFETEEDVLDTLDLLLHLRRPFRLNLFSLTFFPNYEITEMAIGQGVIVEPGTGYTKLEDATGDYASDSLLNNLVYLTQVNLFPRSLIRWMASSQRITVSKTAKALVRLMQGTLASKAFYVALLVLRNPRAVVEAVLRRFRRPAPDVLGH
jgi:radical SAM superfamily enzyme YgiQ (UPF0313 family)